MDLFGGGNLRRMTIFALGIMPYITASIIFQLLTVVYEPLARIQKEGELGRRKITQWTRYMTVVLGALQSIGIAAILTRAGSGAQSRHRLQPDDGAHADRRHGVHHVAGRADYRSRHRQRHEPADLCRHRCGTAARRGRHCSRRFRPAPGDRSPSWPCCSSAGGHDGGGGVHRLRGAVGAAHSRSRARGALWAGA